MPNRWVRADLRRWSYLLIALAVVAVTGITSLANEKTHASIDLSMNGSRTLFGLTIATSHYRFGSPLYVFYNPVFDTFYTKETMTWRQVGGLITKAMAIDPATLTDNQLHIGFGEFDQDDKGIILWYMAAFDLFGPHLSSIYLLYFLMLASSLIIFWLSFRNDDAALTLMALFPLAHLGLTSYVLASNPGVLGTLLGTRPFSMLAALPVLHLVLLMLRKINLSPWLAAGMAAQIAYLLLIVEVRSSVSSAMLILFAVAAFALLRNVRAHGSPFGGRMIVFRRSFIAIPAALLIGLGAIAAAYTAIVPSDVRMRAASSHMVWHAALAGFILNANLSDALLQFAKAYQSFDHVPPHDLLAVDSTIGYAKTVLGQDIGQTIAGAPDIRDVKLYETTARRLFFYEMFHHTKDFAQLYLIQKTKDLSATVMETLWQLPTAGILLAALIIGFLGGAAWLRNLKMTVPLLVFCFSVSTMSAYWFVPSTISMYDYMPYFYLCFLAAIALLGAVMALLNAHYSFIARLKPVARELLPIIVITILPLTIGVMLWREYAPAPGAQSDIVILNATYGGNAGAPHGNATDKIRHACNGFPACNYLVDVAVLGDSAPGASKDFTVEYECSYTLKAIQQTISPEAHMHKILLDCRAP